VSSVHTRITDTYSLINKASTFISEGRLEMTNRDSILAYPDDSPAIVASGNYRDGYRYTISGPGLIPTYAQPHEHTAPFDAIEAAMLPEESVSPTLAAAVSRSNRVWDLITPRRVNDIPGYQGPIRLPPRADPVIDPVIDSLSQRQARLVAPSREEDEEDDESFRRQFLYRR